MIIITLFSTNSKHYLFQPLKDDLDSSVYEVFETDLIKYQQYEKAIRQALADIQKDVMLV